MGQSRNPPVPIYLSSSTLRTTPGRGSPPKWLEPGAAKVSVILENSTSLPPVICITTEDGAMAAGAGPPLSVKLAGPVI
jgi:hypothetical protein